MTTFHYNADCKQPDPEIWGSGVVGGPLVFSSNSQESFLRIYNNEITIPNSATGTISFYASFIFKPSWVGIATHIVSGYIDEKITYRRVGDSATLVVTGSATEKFISSDDTVVESFTTNIFSIEKVTYDYNLGSIVSFSSEDQESISLSVTESSDYGNVLGVVTQGQEDYGSTEILLSTPSSTGNILFNGFGVYSLITEEVNTVLLTLSNGASENISWNPPENEKVYENNLSSLNLTFDNSSLTFDASEPKPDIKLTGSATDYFVSYNPPESEAILTSSGQLIERTTHHYNESSILSATSDDQGSISDSEYEQTNRFAIGVSILRYFEDYVNSSGQNPFNSTRNKRFVTHTVGGSKYIILYTNTFTGISVLNTWISYVDSTISSGIRSKTKYFNFSTLTSQSTEYSNFFTYWQGDQYYSGKSGTQPTSNSLNDIPWNRLTEDWSFDFFLTTTNYSLNGVTGQQIGVVLKVPFSPVTTTTPSSGLTGQLFDTTGNLRSLDTIDYGVLTNSPDQGNEDFNLIVFAETNNPFGTASFSGSAIVKAPDDIRTYRAGANYRVSYNPPENTASLFNIGTISESVVYDYNINSIIPFETENIGSVSDPITETDDYGLTEDIVGVFIDYSSVEFVGEQLPFGLFNVNGSANTEYTNINFYGYVTGAEVKVVYSPDDTTGTLFEFGEKVESIVYDYNLDSTREFVIEDLQSITSSVTITDDYGLISDIETSFIDYGFSDDTSSGTTPFGLFNVNGSAEVEYTNLNFYGYVTGAEVKVVYSPDDTAGTLFGFGEKVESVTYDYNLDSILSVGVPNYGSIDTPTTISEDYGVVSEIHAQTEDSGSILGFSAGEDISPFGSLTIVGSSVEKHVENYYVNDIIPTRRFEFLTDISRLTGLNTSSFVGVAISERGIGTNNINGFNIPRHLKFGNTGGTGVRRVDLISQSLVDYESITFSAIKGNSFNGGEEPDINENLILQYSIDDGIFFNNIGIIVAENDATFNSLKNVTLTIPEIARTSSTILRIQQQGNSGSVFDHYAISQIEITAIDSTPRKLRLSSGYSNIEFISQTPENTPLFTFSGYITETNTESYVGSGTLFDYGYITERTTYSYNLQSDVTYGSDTFGSILDSPTDVLDYGLLTSAVSQGNEDFGSVILSGETGSFGSIFVSGESQNQYQAQTPEDTININVSGVKEESVTYTPPINRKGDATLSSGELSYDSVLETFDTNEQPDIKLTGSSTFSPVIYSETGGGALFNIGEVDESATYDYNTSSVVSYGIEDSGSVTDSITSFVDYGFVDQNLDSGEEDNGDIANVLTLTPFGLFNVNGSANTEWINVNIYGPPEAIVRVVYSPDDTTGTLFGFGEKVESVTYDYNEASALVVEEINNGLIVDSVTISEDYGSVSEPYVGEENGGSIDTITSFAFGFLSISGDAGVVFENATFYGPPEAIVRVVYSPDDTTGTLFGFGEKVESVTYDYNEESIFFAGVTDSGSIDDAISIVDDYGFVYEIHAQVEDYQSLIDFATSTDIYPFGTLNVLGSAFIDATFDEEFSGLFTIFGSAYTDYTPEYTGVGTFNVSGSSIVKFSSVEFGTDDLVVSGTIIETRTKSYNESSILTLDDQLLDYEGLSETTEISVDYGFVNEVATSNTEEFGSISTEITSTIYPFGTITLSGTPLTHPEVDYTPKYTGTGTLIISGSALESETDDFGSDRRRGGNIRYCGDAETREIANYGYYGDDRDPGTSGSIFVNGFITEKETDSYVGLGTIFVSDNAIESDTEVYVGLGSATFSGTALEAYSAQTPEGTQLFTIYGELNHPDIDLTPHYGIEKNIGVGTTGIQISGVVDDSAQRTARGTGTINVINGLSPQDTLAYPGGPSVGRSWSFTRTTYIADTSSPITISTGIAQTHYYSPIYPRNALIGDPSSGIGTIRINDDKGLAFYRAVLPIFAKGKIYILGIGTAGNGDLDGVEIGATESFTPATEIGTGLFAISGVSSTRQIDVYQDIITGGLITISQQTKPSIEKYTASWVGIGTIFVSDTIIERNTEAYFGSGSILAISGGAEAYSAQTPEDTATLQISGSAQESFVAQTPEDTVLYTFVGNSQERYIPSPVGSGTIYISGSSDVTASPSYAATGTIKLGNRPNVDNSYDTCDSVDITSDIQDSAYVSFTANPPEDTILFNIDGIANTSETALYTDVVTGLYKLLGTYQDLKLTHSESGIGTIFITETVSESESDVYIGSGSLFALSGGTEYYSAQTPDSTVLLQISGSAITSVESEYTAVGIGLFGFYGTAITSEIATYTKTGLGNITLSGELVYPNIKFIPSPDGSGTINIIGTSEHSVTKIYDTIPENLFTFSSGLESFTKSTYTGIGTIHTLQISGSTVNNPFQIPRTYVCII